MSHTTHANDPASFQHEVLDADRPVIVDFWAAWCGPCRMVAPELDALAAKYGDSIKIVKVDVDANPSAASTYGVRSIPMIALFENGELTKQTVGARPRQAIETDLGLSRYATAGGN